MRKLELSDERRAELVTALQGYFTDEFDETLSSFRAEELLTFMLGQIGPSLYNAGIQDARTFLTERLDDLDTDFTLAEDA